MAQVEGLNLRGSRYYVRIIIPGDLRHIYGKTRINAGLDTSDRREATLRATLKRAEWLADFEVKRQTLNPQTLEVITPGMASLMAERIRARVLQGDDELRQDFALLEDLARAAAPRPSALRIPTGTPENQSRKVPPRDKLAGMTADEARVIAGLNSFMDAQAGGDYARRNLAAVLPHLQADAQRLGLAFDLDTPGVPEALSVCLAAYRKARQEVTLRDAGNVVETPAAPALVPTAKPAANEAPKTLRDVFDRWKLSGATARSADSIGAYGRAVAQFEGQHPGIALKAINGDLGDLYRAWLLANCNTPKTARDRLTAIKSLMKYATEKLEWIPKHPWRGLEIKATTTNKRRPWTDDEITALFTAPLHASYAVPDAAHAGRDAAYWIPLLGLYTGARLGELCQLRTVDIQTIEGIAVMVLTDDGEDQSIKSDAGHRSVPLHSELIRLGFLGYVEAIRATGADSLWPSMKMRAGKPSDFFGRWFRVYRTSQGVDGARPDFHCFRHTVRPLMRRAGFSEETQDKVTGHKARGSVGTVVYGHWTLTEIRAAVEAIKYPALALPVVSPHAGR
jgi:integrase